LDFIKSNHFIASWNHNLNRSTRIKLETYYQSVSGLATDPNDGGFSMVNFGADFGFPNRAGLTNDGTGHNYGIELTLERFLNKGFYYLVTGSVFDSKYKGYDEVERNTFFNSNYVFNILAGKEIQLNKKLTLTFDARFTYAGGRRYTPIDLQASIVAGEEVENKMKVFQERFPSYIRPDLKFGLRKNKGKITQIWFVDLQNFIGRKNVFFYQYDENNQEIDTRYQRKQYINIFQSQFNFLKNQYYGSIRKSIIKHSRYCRIYKYRTFLDSYVCQKRKQHTSQSR